MRPVARGALRADDRGRGLDRPFAFALSALAVLVVAAGLRVWGLGAASLWYDEALTLDIVRAPLTDLAADVRAREQVPPLYHVLMHAWVDWLGDSEIAARLPSALFGIAAVGVAIALGRALFGAREGIVAGAMMALSGFQVYYSQEARPYALLVLASLLSCLAFVRMKRTGGWRGRALYVAATAVLLWTHLYGVFVILAQHLAWLSARVAARRGIASPDDTEAGPAAVRLREWLGMNAIVLLLFAPWIPTVVLWVGQVSGHFWIPPMGPERVLTAYITYAGSTPLLVVLIGLAVLGAVRTERRWKVVLLAGVFLLPVVVPVAASMIGRPVFVPRYGIMAATGLYLLAARGWTALPATRLALRWIVAAVVLGLTLVDVYGAPRRLDPKPDWRAATAYVLGHDRAGDAILLNADFNNLVFQHYAARRARDVDAAYLIDGRVGDGADSESLELPAAGNLWVVTEAAAYHNYRVRTTSDIERLGLELAETHTFDDITVQRFVPNGR